MKQWKHSLKKLLALLLVITMLFTLTGCNRSLVDFDALFSYVKLWALVNGYMDPHTEEIDIGRMGIHLMFFRGDDPVLNTAAEVNRVVKTIEKADTLAEQGFSSNSEDKLEQAIDLRPSESRYYAMLGVNQYYKDPDYRIDNLEEMREAYTQNNGSVPDHLLLRHQSSYPEVFDKGNIVASSQGADEQIKYLNNVRYYAEKDHDFYHGRKALVTDDGFLIHEGYIDWAESLARHQYLLKKLAEYEHQQFNTAASSEKLNQAKQEYDESVSNLKEAMRMYAAQEVIQVIE